MRISNYFHLNIIPFKTCIFFFILITFVSCNNGQKNQKNGVNEKSVDVKFKKENNQPFLVKILNDKGFQFEKDLLIHKGFEVKITNNTGHDLLDHKIYLIGKCDTKITLIRPHNEIALGWWTSFEKFKVTKEDNLDYWNHDESIVYEFGKTERYNLSSSDERFLSQYGIEQSPIEKVILTITFTASNELQNYSFNDCIVNIDYTEKLNEFLKKVK